jgi:branched-subunit amino acid aminotransferase/4-amino-4-deoxychorismate lyase
MDVIVADSDAATVALRAAKRGAGIRCRGIRRFSPPEVPEPAEEVVLTSTLAGVVPVGEIEGIENRFPGGGGELAEFWTEAYGRLLDHAAA